MDELPVQAASIPEKRLHSEMSYKRLERGKFVWPQAKEGAVSLTPAQLSMLTEGIDWRMPARTWQPEMVG